MDTLALTPRQREVLVQLQAGKSNKEIGRTLTMAESTVKIHTTEIFKVLEVSTRSQAMAKVNNLKQLATENTSELTEVEILRAFANSMFTFKSEDWSDRMITFGRAISKLEKDK